MQLKEDSWEATPSYLDLYHGFLEFCQYFRNHSELISIGHQVDQVQKHNQITSNDVLMVLFIASVWTIARHFSSKLIFLPLGRKFNLSPNNQEKMPESAWKLLCYTFTWSLTFYSVVYKHRFFQRPSSVWDDWDLEAEISFDLYTIYIVQASFYLHSLYATAYQDIWRKDSILLLAHHVLTLGLMAISHGFRYNKIGALVLLFHDISDIQLEFTKLNVYFKVQRGQVVAAHDIIANYGFVCFTITWFISRIYWFPLKSLYAAAVLTIDFGLGDKLPILFFVNTLLWALLAMDVYWFLMILVFLFKVVTGQIQEIDDTREYDVQEKLDRMNKEASKGNGHSNGHLNGNTQNGFHGKGLEMTLRNRHSNGK